MGGKRRILLFVEGGGIVKADGSNEPAEPEQRDGKGGK